MWDGLGMQVNSPVFEVLFDEKARASVKHVQDIPTSAAQRWRHLALLDFLAAPDDRKLEFVAVANLIGPSAVYRWSATHAQPVDVASKTLFHRTGAAVCGRMLTYADVC